MEAPESSSADDVKARLLGLICPEPLGDDRFAIDISDRVSGHLFGGLVAAQGLHAATTTVSPERRVHSVHAYFLRRGRPELPLSFVVDRDADGGSFSARRITVEQEGRAIFSMAASFHRHARIDRWHYIELEPHAVADARGLYSGRMWELGGAQVMSIAQECLLRPPP